MRRATSSSGASIEHVDVVLPADREVLLELGDRVEVGGPVEAGVEHLHVADPVDPVGPAGVGGVRVAQEVPPAVADHDRPRVHLAGPLRAGLGAVADPHPPALRAGLHQRDAMPGSGRTAARSGAAAVVLRSASAWAATGSGSARMILPSALPTGSVGSLAAWWPSSTAITRPRASVALNVRGGSRSPRPSR